MSLPEQLQRDRALRDAAWDVVSQDVSWLQADLDHRSVPGRVVDHLEERAREIAGNSYDAAMRNKLAVGAAAAAIGLWLVRRPLMDAVSAAWSGLHREKVREDSGTEDAQGE